MNKNKSIQSGTKPETRLQKLLTGVLRWGLVGLIAFGVGALLITFALYIPTRQKLNKAIADLTDANTTISEKTDQISTLQTENDNLHRDLESATLHIDVLKVLAGLRGASLAVEAGDYTGARLLLIQASDALDTLSGRLGEDQKDLFIAMQQSASQVLADVQNNLKSSQSELDQLVNNLVQLENNLFPSP